jgi:hypothetical protein
MRLIAILVIVTLITGCSSEENTDMKQIIFLHHSTGKTVWLGNTSYLKYKITNKGDAHKYFSDYNKENNTDYKISEMEFPKSEPYGWKNYPYDYYNIWVKNAGESEFMEEPTLEILTKQYDVIIFKHCFPVSSILEDTGSPSIDSEEKRVENYMLQYEALKEKLHEFPEHKFILWTPAALVKNSTNEAQAKRVQTFYHWILQEWDEEDDNIFIWDFYDLETEGGLYLKDEYAVGPNDSHPNSDFAASLTPLFCQFIIDCVENE